MKRLTLLAVTAMLTLAACDQLPFLQGDKSEGNAAAETNGSAAGNASAAAAPASAGVTSSRSLAGLSGGGADGGKDPATAIQAGASQGTLDPRLVGRWSDTGDCKDAVDLRADGTFLAQNGGNGRWRVDGNNLVFFDEDQVVELQIEAIEPDRIVTTSAEGQTGPSIRC